MDKLAQYRQYVQTLITRYAEDDVSDDRVEVQLILDTERDHYQWMNVGWEHLTRIYQTIIHIDIKDGKIWPATKLDRAKSCGGISCNGSTERGYYFGIATPLQTAVY